MINSQNIVSDLLLGFGAQPVPQQGPTGASIPVAGSGSFASLLSLFSGVGLNLQGSINSEKQFTTANETADPMVLNSSMQAQVQMLLGMGFTQATPTSANVTSHGTHGTTGTFGNAQPTALGLGTNKASVQLIAANRKALDLPVREIPEGSYRVKDASISNGNLNLTLVHMDDQNTELKVTLPTQTLSQDPKNDLPIQVGAGVTRTGSGPSLHTAQNKQFSGIEQFLSQLKASEVTINQPLPTTANPAEQAPIMTIQAQLETNPMAVVGATSVARPLNFTRTIELSDNGETISEHGNENSKVIISTGSGHPKGAEQFVSAVQPVQAQFKTGAAEAQPFFRPTAFKINNRVMTQESPTVAALIDTKESSSAAVALQNESTSGSSSLHMLRQEPSMTFRQDQTAVRVTVPKDLSGLLDGSHKSVSIKLDPDYLGPARLSLVMRGEVLSAKITVDTQQAKAALDNSMTQLTDQLAHAGVKVDLINVSVRGGGADNQSFHRPQQWFTNHQRQITNNESIQAFGASALEAANHQMSASYVHGRGVNLYA